MSDRKQVPLRMVPELYDFYKQESDKKGLTMHGFLIMALSAYKEQYEEQQKDKR